jgi:hypothetical protein
VDYYVCYLYYTSQQRFGFEVAEGSVEGDLDDARRWLRRLVSAG